MGKQPGSNGLASSPAPAPHIRDYWDAKRNSRAQPIVQTVLWMCAFAVQSNIAVSARREGVPAWHASWTWWFWFPAFILMNVGLHESAHALVAWLAGFKLRIVSIGPFIFYREHSRFRYRFHLPGMFDNGGYIGAVPVSERNLLFNETAVIAAGPAVNALTCIASLVVFSLRSPQWQSWWWIAALNAVAAGFMTVGNLIPLGYCDGTMLLHLVLRTPAGWLLLHRLRILQMGEEADACHGAAAFEREIESKKAMLQRSLAFGQDNAFMIAAGHQALGSAYALVEDWAAAEFHYRQCLEFEAELALKPALAANAWSGLHLASIRRYQVADAGIAYAKTVALLERLKLTGADFLEPVVTFAMLGQAHLRNGAYAGALADIEQALRRLPADPGRTFLRAHLLRSQAVCFLHLGDIEAGLAAARSTAALLRSPEVPMGRRNLAWEELAHLGDALWQAGQCSLPVELVREAIARLEAGGAIPVAAHYRVKLAGMLHYAGYSAEALDELSGCGAATAAVRRAMLALRAELHLAAGRPGRSLSDARELLALWQNHPYRPAVEIACAEAVLAKASLETGDRLQAEIVGIRSAGVLVPLQHPAAAGCLITLGLARAHFSQEWSAARIHDAFRLLDQSVLLDPAGKARFKEVESARIAVPALA